MANFLRWDPRRELNNLRVNMNRILEEGLASVNPNPIAVDVYETPDAVVVETSPLPGVQPDHLEVSITGNVLTISGKSEEAPKDASTTYLRKERRFGEFSRSITIPRPVKADEAVARFKDNILTVTIPKAEEARPHVIDIDAADE